MVESTTENKSNFSRGLRVTFPEPEALYAHMHALIEEDRDEFFVTQQDGESDEAFSKRQEQAFKGKLFKDIFGDNFPRQTIIPNDDVIRGIETQISPYVLKVDGQAAVSIDFVFSESVARLLAKNPQQFCTELNTQCGNKFPNFELDDSHDYDDGEHGKLSNPFLRGDQGITIILGLTKKNESDSSYIPQPDRLAKITKARPRYTVACQLTWNISEKPTEETYHQELSIIHQDLAALKIVIPALFRTFYVLKGKPIPQWKELVLPLIHPRG